MRYPTPNQNECSGPPDKIECPSCGKANGLQAWDKWSKHLCGHCDEEFQVIQVSETVTIWVKRIDGVSFAGQGPLEGVDA